MVPDVCTLTVKPEVVLVTQYAPTEVGSLVGVTTHFGALL
jgi:hypothetical protein